ncbi:MAG: DUF2330 domain-containing protein [Planctomycetota bacterium]
MAILAAVLLCGGIVFADGKFYRHYERIPPNVPYQRALLLFDGQTETLLLQSKYEVEDSKTASALGWVVPLPAVPGLATMSVETVNDLFHSLNLHSQPEVTLIRRIVSDVILCISLLLLLVALLLCALSRRFRILEAAAPRPGFLGCVLLLLLVVIFLFPTTLGGVRQYVEVLVAEQVGIYDVKVVKSDRADALIVWLNENKFKFDDSDREAFGKYIGRGWCFVVAKVNPSSKTQAHKIAMQGLAAPLIMRFPTEKAVYPLALTGTGGQPTEILLYTATRQKMTTDGRLELWFAGQSRGSWLESYAGDVEPKGFIAPSKEALSCLCKFKGTLTPDQMRDDLYLANAPDNVPYQKHITRW